jgi:hypothetical protein
MNDLLSEFKTHIYQYFCSPFIFEKQRWINFLFQDFSFRTWKTMVYKVEKSNCWYQRYNQVCAHKISLIPPLFFFTLKKN